MGMKGSPIKPTQLSASVCNWKYTSRTKLNLSDIPVLNMFASLLRAFLSYVLKISSGDGLWKSLVELSVLWAMPARQQPLIPNTTLGKTNSAWICGSCGTTVSLLLLSRHIDCSLFHSRRQRKSGPGSDSHPMDQCYKMKSNRPGPASGFTFRELFLHHADVIRHDQQQLCGVF